MPKAKPKLLDLSGLLDEEGFDCSRCEKHYPAPVTTVVEPETHNEICQECAKHSPYCS